MGKSFFEKVKNTICYCGLTKEAYKNIKKDAYVSNFNVWKSMHILLAFIFGAIFVYTTLSGVYSANRFAYAFMFIYSVITSFLFFFVIKPDSLIGQFYIYLTMVLLMICGVILSVTQPDMMAVTFMIMLVASPMFMIDKPYFMGIVLAIAAVIHIIAIFKYKNESVFVGDVMNTIVFTFLGIIVNVFYNSVKIKEIALKRQIERQRDTDELTGLKSKNALTHDINKVLKKDSSSGVLAVMDIDHFKQINDSYGHAFGDSVLHKIGRIMSSVMGPEDVGGRFGGDEFILFFNGDTDMARAESAVKTIIERVNKEVQAPNEVIGICGGIALKSNSDKDYDSLFRKADNALYLAKDAGRNTYELYKEEQ